MRLLMLCLATAALVGCETLEYADRRLNESTPTHPVTGAPIVNVVDETREVEQAERGWRETAAAAVQQGVAVDRPGPHSDAVQRVFARLVDVAHRRELPWQVHVVDSPDVNAFTFGGGVVVVFEGLFGGMIPNSDDDALAAVLAHEIAHVTLLHVPMSQTWQALGPLVSKKADDKYYRAAYSTAQEAEADKLSLLYVALAGYDIAAPTRVWAAAHRREGSDAADFGYLHDHPMDAERAAITRNASAQVVQYWIRGERNPNADEILAENVLFPRTPDVGSSSGTGFVKALAATLDALQTHDEATDDASSRRKEAGAFAAIRILRVFEAPTSNGYVGLFVDLHNGSHKTVKSLKIQVIYLNGKNELLKDPSCRGTVSIAPGQTGQLGCYKRAVQGATQIVAEVVDIQF